MEENVELPAPSIRRHVSRIKGVLALGNVGDATFESSYPLDVGVLADFSESLAKFGDEERHRSLCGLLHLLKSVTLKTSTNAAFEQLRPHSMGLAMGLPT